MSDPELISCLMVTRPERLDFAKESIGAYLRQSHAPRELVVVLDAAPEPAVRALLDWISGLERPDIRVISPQGTPTLGALRNRAVAASRGAVLCQWDDDDLHHPERIAQQLAALCAGADACALQEVFQLDATTRELFLTTWIHAPIPAHPGTLMCRAAAMPRYPETGPTSARGEDREVLEQLLARHAVTALSGAPRLFVYRMHGENVSGAAHQRMLRDTLSVSAGILRRREAALRADLAAFNFGTEPVTVAGPNGAAFQIMPRRTTGT